MTYVGCVKSDYGMQYYVFVVPGHQGPLATLLGNLVVVSQTGRQCAQDVALALIDEVVLAPG